MARMWIWPEVANLVCVCVRLRVADMFVQSGNSTDVDLCGRDKDINTFNNMLQVDIGVNALFYLNCRLVFILCTYVLSP